MMAPFRFEHIAHQAVPPPLILIVSLVKSPENWHLAGISEHCLEEAPKKHEREDMEENNYNLCK